MNAAVTVHLFISGLLPLLPLCQYVEGCWSQRVDSCHGHVSLSRWRYG